MKRPACATPMFVTLLVALTSVLAGCGSDDEAAPPPAVSCPVSGQVGGCVAGTRTEIGFESVGSGAAYRSFRVTVDHSGRYEVELPVGDYRALLVAAGNQVYHAAEGVTLAEAQADTLRLRAGSPVRVVDFPLGSLRVATAVPAGLAGADFLIAIQSVGRPASEPMTTRVTRETAYADSVSVHFATLFPCEYAVEMQLMPEVDRTGEHFWLPDATNPASAARYRVSADSVSVAVATLAAEPALISGRINGGWQALGSSPPYVYLETPEGEELVGSWRAAADGSFELPMYVPRPFILGVRGNSTHAWVGGTSAATATVFTPQPGQVLTGLDVDGGGLLLHVSYDYPNAARTEVRFELSAPGDPTPVWSWYTTLGRQVGAACLPPGTWQLHVMRPYDDLRLRWRPQWFDRAANAEAAMPLVIAADGSILELDLRLERGGVIAGAGVEAPADSTAWCEAVLASADTRAVIGTRIQPSWSAPFQMTGIEDGSYRVGLVPGGFADVGSEAPAATIWYPGTTDWNEAGVITIADADSVGGLLIARP